MKENVPNVVQPKSTVEILQAFFRGGYLVASQDYDETRYFLEPYVCTECGYVEFRLNKESLNKISILIQDKELWQKII